MFFYLAVSHLCVCVCLEFFLCVCVEGGGGALKPYGPRQRFALLGMLKIKIELDR